jgi:hypothetical protein
MPRAALASVRWERTVVFDAMGTAAYLNSGVPGTKASNAAQNCAR